MSLSLRPQVFCVGVWQCESPSGSVSEKVSVLCVFSESEVGAGQKLAQGGENKVRAMAEAHLLMFPLMCWYLGRQGSSGKGSWENTESSPEEQELRVSGKLGEYCSVGVHRSRYS